MTVAANKSRNAQSHLFDEWLKSNRVRLEKQSPTAIAQELRRLGFYSPKTTLTDIRSSFLSITWMPLSSHEFRT